jgi:HAE1 family hydrophobic/amphiphilic exporter-1
VFSHFFIDRPRFAFVISILITLVGLMAMQNLPIAQFPQITPPVVEVTASYPGASAEVVEATVAQPIEAKVNGVENMIYLSSKSANDGSYTLEVTFEIGTDPDIAAVEVQNRVSQSEPQLPEEVVRQGIVTQKKSTDMLLIVNLISPGGTFDSLFLANYSLINLRDPILRANGVGDVVSFGGSDYGMRIWLDPDKMAERKLTTEDVAAAIREQNLQAPAGQIGQAPIVEEQQFQYSVVTRGRLDTVEEFEDIVLRANPDGSTMVLGDVARVELGAESYANSGRLTRAASALLAVYQLPDANALDTAAAVRAEVEALAHRFPEDLEYRIVYDTTEFVQTSIDEVVVTLFQAMALVILVVYLFLGDLRSTLIPAIAIPVSLVGTFAFMQAFGFTINTISLFALILAIGIVVDDAIVVVENVRRLMDEGKSPRDATREAMVEVSGPIVATTLVLMAVFVPVAFIPGITGRLYQQFAVTISISVLISSLNALTLSPALCATLLRPSREFGRGPLGRALAGFEALLGRLAGGYERLVRVLVSRLALPGAIFGGVVLGTVLLFRLIPTGFLPAEDVGYFFINIQLPDGAAMPRTEAVTKRVEDLLDAEPGVQDYLAIPGYSLLAGTSASNTAVVIAVLDPWDQRPGAALHQDAIMNRLRGKLWAIQEANVIAFGPPPISGLGTTGGFEFELQDRAGGTPAELAQAATTLIEAANRDPVIQSVYTTYRANVPQVYLEVDRNQVKTLGIPLSEVFATLQTQLGSLYVNDFNKFGKVYKVLLQAEPGFRTRPEDIARLQVRNAAGEMIPVTAVLSTERAFGPDLLNRFNLFRSASITGAPAPGRSSGEAIARMQELAAEVLPDTMGYEWSGTSFQEIRAAGQVGAIFALAVLFAYLFLVAQYESWSIPAAVILSVPIAILGALGATALVGLDSNAYTQIGLVMLVGLASKTAILMVEFAKARREEGLEAREAALEAARLRFRAVLMTAVSFVLGVLPLVIATGAGAASRRSLGTAVFGGMLVSTVVATLLVPAFYAAVQLTRERVKGPDSAPAAPPDA